MSDNICVAGEAEESDEEGIAENTEDVTPVESSNNKEETSQANTAIQESVNKTVYQSALHFRLKERNLEFRIGAASRHGKACTAMSKKYNELSEKLDGTENIAMNTSQNLRKTIENLEKVENCLSDIHKNSKSLLPAMVFS